MKLKINPTLSQTFTVPSTNIEGQPSAASLSFYFYYAATTTETTYPHQDYIFVYIVGSGGQQTGPRLLEYDVDHPSDINWKLETIDLNSYRGQTITMRFELYLNEVNRSNFYIDDVRVRACEAREPS